MWVTRRYLSAFSRRPILASAFSLSILLCGGCLMEPAPGDAPAESASGPESLREQPSGTPSGKTGGCTKVWSDAKMDSVNFCPDPRPPKPG